MILGDNVWGRPGDTWYLVTGGNLFWRVNMKQGIQQDWVMLWLSVKTPIDFTPEVIEIYKLIDEFYESDTTI